MKTKVLKVIKGIKYLVAFVNPEDQARMGLKLNDRVKLTYRKREVTAFQLGVFDQITPGGLAISSSVQDRLGCDTGDAVDVSVQPNPKSVKQILRKIGGEKLDQVQISSIVNDIYRGALSAIEISAWLTALSVVGMDLDEIVCLQNAIVNTGERIQFDRQPVFDFHSMGGVPGNKITPIVVSICAAAGLMIPKTSSRAISSACGTSDFVEVFCPVALSHSRLKEIGESIGGAFAWGGAMDLASVDDTIIDIEYQLGINPRPQMLASIMAKKLAIGADYLLIDIPMGTGTKVPDEQSAQQYQQDFISLGKKLGIHTECVITYAGQPVGHAVGPALEARECIQALECSGGPTSVVEKACECAGIILEMSGISNGIKRAREILESGEALKKFREIVEAQGGNPDVKSDDIVPGAYTYGVTQVRDGFVTSVDNKNIVFLARSLGAPADKGAGILLNAKEGSRLLKGDLLFTMYQDNEVKLQNTIAMLDEHPVAILGGMVVKRISR